MPDVHLLRDVRRRVVDDDAFLVAARGTPRRSSRATVCSALSRNALFSVRLMKPGPAISTRSADVRKVGCGDDGFGDLARRALQRLRKTHREIGLEVGALGAAHHRIDVRVLGAEGFRDGGLQPSREHGSRVVTSGGHGALLATGRAERRMASALQIPVFRGRVVYGAARGLGPPRRRMTSASRLTPNNTRALVQTNTYAPHQGPVTEIGRLSRFRGDCVVAPLSVSHSEGAMRSSGVVAGLAALTSLLNTSGSSCLGRTGRTGQMSVCEFAGAQRVAYV